MTSASTWSESKGKPDAGRPAKRSSSLTAPLCSPLRYAGDQTYFDEIKQFYYRDEFSHQVQEWNRQRTLAIERALNQFLYPQMAKELKSKLVAEARESIVRVRRHEFGAGEPKALSDHSDLFWVFFPPPTCSRAAADCTTG